LKREEAEDMAGHYRICVIPGDGIGLEVIPIAVRALEAAAGSCDIKLTLTEEPWGSAYYLKTGSMMPENGHEIVGRADATLFGAVGSPDVPDTISAWGLILSARQKLDLYVNLRPIRARPASPAVEPRPQERDFNMMIVRENTEGEYSGVGGRLFQGTNRESASAVALFTRHGIERIVDYAFGIVPTGGLLTSVTKSNALPHTMGLWDDVAEAVAARHAQVRWERMHVDAVAYQMVRAPGRFNVLVASNLFGDILSDLGAGLQGSLGIAASGNINPKTGVGIFEPIHGSAPDIAGQGIANPLGAIASAAMLLDFLGEKDAAALVQGGIDAAMSNGALTRDLGGSCSTVDVGDEVVRWISQAGPR
jgi:tartrate dehydrogenase/decarboxylase / D-malate dehydrogenase